MVIMLLTQSQKRLLKPPIRAHFTKPKICSSKIKKPVKNGPLCRVGQKKWS